MVESSKILTVSYGTFSCTLEGFDDSFSTMKAIAEYFRDLAAGDRYFGAEPPTPDTEMLTRIAEREISRRVEARTSDSGIVLRASEGTAQPQPTMPPAPEAPDMDPAQAEAVAAEPRPETGPVAMPEQAPKIQHPDSESVADKLKRIRSVVGNRTSDGYTEDLEESAVDDTPDTNGEPVQTRHDAPPTDIPERLVRAKASDDDTVVDDSPEAQDTTPADNDDSIDDGDTDDMSNANQPDATVGDLLQSDDITETDEHESTVTLADDADQSDDDDTDDQIQNVLRNLERNSLRRENMKSPPKAKEDTPDVKASGIATSHEDTDDIADRIARTLAGATQDDELEQAAVDPSVTAPDVDVASAILAAGAVEQDDTNDEETSELPPVADTSDIADTVETVEDNDDMPSDAAPDEDAPRDLADTPDTDAESMDAAPQDQAPPSSPSRPRILRVMRRPRVSEESEAPVDAKSDPNKPLPQSAPLATTSSTLSHEDEADLQRALAEAEQDAVAETITDQDVFETVGPDVDMDDASQLSDESDSDTAAELQAQDDVPDDAVAATLDDDTDVADDMIAESGQDDDTPAERDALPTTSDEEVGRISAQADEELANPESSRRRNAIAHLKAAVAATEAARQLGEPRKNATDEENVFRDDLAEAVRPRRPSAEALDRTPRERPAPLKLVASQRVDATQTGDTAVQPRRIAKVNEPAVADNFAAYADSVGATSLQDLLEAAAAYTAIVEGAEDFSRPQIMKKVEATTTEPFTREDGLRSFGTLLRQGRLEKTRNGRFQISDRTRFRPEAQAANG